MATTTNYGWTTPDDTDLVKNGADAIRVLGASIDTSMNTALGTNKAGLVLLNTTSFSAVGSQSINDVFTSTYDSYRIVLKLTSSSAVPQTITGRLRLTGTDTTTNYKSYFVTSRDSNYTGGTSFVLTSSTALVVGYRHSTTGSSVSAFDLHYPQIAANTHNQGFYNSTGNTSEGNAGQILGVLNDTTQYTSISFLTSTGTITGNVSIYGYNK
jgi:hypothetical protein